MQRRRIVAEILASCAFFLLLLLSVSWYGKSHVRMLERARIDVVARPSDAYALWKDSGIRGRILLLFDRRLNAQPYDVNEDYHNYERLMTPNNYLYVAMSTGIVRKVYHIVPEGSWDEVRHALSGYFAVVRLQDTFRMTLAEGVRVYVMRLRDLPSIGEKTLISINGAWWDDGGIREIVDVLQRKGIRSDDVTLSGPPSQRTLSVIRDYVGNASQ